MVQQSLAVASALLGRSAKWSPQSRDGRGYSWRMTARFHALETVTGAAMIACMVIGSMSLWLAPIAISLILAIPLSKLSAWRISEGRFLSLRLDTPHTLREPRIMSAAKAERAALQAYLELTPTPLATAAE
jgi:membrane glycosyltransferase